MFDDIQPPKKATHSALVGDKQMAIKKNDESFINSVASGLGNTAGGIASGFADIGNTLINAAVEGGEYVRDKVTSPAVSELVTGRQPSAIKRWNDARNESLKAFNDEHNDSTAFNVGRIGGNVAATWPVGGVLGAGVKALSAAPKVQALGNAISSGGFRTGINLADDASKLAKLGNIGLRSAGGAITGGASTALVSPDSALTGAMVGAALPPAIAGAARGSEYLGNAMRSFVQPFTQKGQEEIAQNVIRQFARGGPTSINAAQIVPGSTPTLAEATGNAGLATLQRGTRDIRPNAFIEREAQNAAARTALFDEIAGDPSKLEFFKADRKTVAKQLYDEALDQANQQPLTPWLKGQITQLNKAPTILEARKEAQRLARDRLEKPSFNGSLRGLQDMKTIIDDKISKAVREGRGGEAESLGNLQNKLTTVMEKLSQTYAEANATYAAMSKPINSMETLQGLRLTDARGNITLAKVKNSIESLERLRSAPGFNAAKSVTDDQLSALRAIHDDLLRQDNLGLGRSIGSNTFQNLATDNILNSALGDGLSRLADKYGVSGVLGQVGRLAYSGPNEAIRNRLVNMMLDPQLAAPGLVSNPQLAAPGMLTRILSDSRVQQPLYLAAPVVSTSR
jgi:hypothetical protein